MPQLVHVGGGIGPGRGAATVVPTLGVVASSRGQVATATTNVAQNFTSRRTHWASSQGSISNLKCVDANWYIINTTFIPTTPGAVIVMKRYIEYPADVFHQVTWSASGTLSMPANSTVHTSDVVNSSITGLPLVIPAGAKFWVRTGKTSAGTQAIAIQELPAAANVLGVDDGNSNSDLANSGTIGPSSTVNSWGPICILGDIQATGAKSFALVGDSLPWGTGDVTSADSKFNTGWLPRSVGQSYPYIKIAKGGWSASDLAGSASVAFTNLFAAISVTDAVFTLGVNDLRLGRTKAQVLADQATNRGRFGASVRKWQTTITPRSDSTDSYATTTNQTPKTDGNMADLTPLNTDIRAVPAGLTGIVEAADFAMSARDSNIWGGPFPPVTDGVHPTTAKAEAMAALYTP